MKNILVTGSAGFVGKNLVETLRPREDVVLTTFDIKDGVRIDIYDNGGGIPDTMVNKIFDPYFSTKSTKNGTGLGLYMSKIIIEEQHKGKLYYKNINHGVSFSIELYE